MIRRIDHISIAVRDLHKAKAFFLGGLGGARALFHADESTEISLDNLRTRNFLPSGTDRSSGKGWIFASILGNPGEGPHHITLQVNDIQETRRALEERGIPTFGFSEELPGWKELYIHPKNAFGMLIQFAEFNPLDWVNPGYIPPAYREFVPTAEKKSEKRRVEIRRVETEEGPMVEILQEGEVIHIPQEQLEGFIQALKDSR
jgi:methylmalonyl-CoA/ethylmalonyl-CoA epimerase